MQNKEQKKEKPIQNPSEAKKMVKEGTGSLNVQLLWTILNGNFDKFVIQNFLDQGASPTEKHLFKGIQTTALSAALAKWVVQGFMSNTPVDKACSQLKCYADEPPSAQEPFACSWNHAYKCLFGEEPPIDPLSSDKVAAIKKVFVDVYQLLNSVEKCIPLFEMIEEELIIEWQKTHDGPIPKLDEKEYQVQCHDKTLYPIPREEYKKTCFPKKNSALQKTLYRMMRDMDLVKIPPQKWIQGVPREKSKEYLKQNVFFVEDRSHPTGLLHGKVSHNIQRLLICLAIKKNLVNMHVGDFHITIEELFSSLMDKQYANQQTKSFLWSALLDTRLFSYVTFTDPHRVHSFLMTSDRRSQFRLLSDCMIHSFCNGIVEISEILNHYHSDKVKIWSPQKVWDRILSCMSTEYFFSFELNVNYRESRKGYAPIIARGTGKMPYIIVEKDYANKEDIKKQMPEPSRHVEIPAKELQLRAGKAKIIDEAKKLPLQPSFFNPRLTQPFLISVNIVSEKRESLRLCKIVGLENCSQFTALFALVGSPLLRKVASKRLECELNVDALRAIQKVNSNAPGEIAALLSMAEDELVGLMNRGQQLLTPLPHAGIDFFPSSLPAPSHGSIFLGLSDVVPRSGMDIGMDSLASRKIREEMITADGVADISDSLPQPFNNLTGI